MHEEHRPNRDTVPKSQLKVLSQEISDEEGLYRIQAAQRIHYMTIKTDVYDEDTMCRPYLLIPALPELPAADWTRGNVTRSADGSLTLDISHEALPAVQKTWHPVLVDVLSLPEIEGHKSGVFETVFKGRPAIAKFARLPWHIPQMNRETAAYAFLSECEQSNEFPVAPKVLGHLTEHGRVMGLLLEKVEGRFASEDDLAGCEQCVRKLHDMGLVHGDVNKYNFLIGRDGRVRIVDFEHAEPFEEAAALAELESLPAELAEDTGRGTVMEFSPCQD